MREKKRKLYSVKTREENKTRENLGNGAVSNLIGSEGEKRKKV